MTNEKTTIFLPPEAVATRLGISLATLKRLRLDGKIAHWRITPRIVVFTDDQIDAYLDGREVRASEMARA